MAEDRVYVALDKIEKLIVDGQKEVSNQIRQVNDSLGQRIDNVEEKIVLLDRKIDKIDKKHDINAQALYGLLQDVDNKLERHLRQPAHVTA